MLRAFNRKLYTRIFRFVSVEAKLCILDWLGAVYSYIRGNTAVFDRERVPNIKRLFILHLCRNFPVGNHAVVGFRSFGECKSHHEDDTEKYISHYFFPSLNSFKAKSPYQIPANLKGIERPA